LNNITNQSTSGLKFLFSNVIHLVCNMEALM